MKTRIVCLFMLLIIVFTSNNFLFSQNNLQNNNNSSNTQNLFQYKSPEEETRGPGYFSLVFKTLFILALFGFGVYYLFKYISQKQGLMTSNVNLIKLLASLPVGTNRFVQLIEMGNNYFLLGVSDNNINLLKEITDKETINLIQVMKSQKTPLPEKIVFTEFLKSILHGITKKTTKGDGLKFLKKQKERLQNFKIKF